MFVGRQKYGDQVKADTILQDVMREIYVPPTANSLPTRFTSFLPTPRPPVRLYVLRERDLYFSVVTGTHYGTKTPPDQQPTKLCAGV